MSARCPHCGTPVDEVPLDRCDDHGVLAHWDEHALVLNADSSASILDCDSEEIHRIRYDWVEQAKTTFPLLIALYLIGRNRGERIGRVRLQIELRALLGVAARSNADSER